ncbi:MAG TPA: PAS domain-containing protein [Phenylobacterium sp.]
MDAVENLGAGAPIVRSPIDASSLGMAFILESKPDGARRFVFAGPRCLGLNGVTGEAAMADPTLLYDMILPEHRKVFDETEAYARKTVQPFDVEVAMRRADGEVRWHRFAALPRLQPEGVMLWDGLQIDVTDRRDMAAMLQEQRRRLEVAVEATSLGFWEWDIEAGTVNWSDRNKELYGLPLDAQLSVARYLELVHPEDVDKVRAAFQQARDKPNGGDYSLEHRIVTPAGEVRWILVHGRVATNDAGGARLVVGTSMDITERRAEDERRALLMGELAHRAKNGIAVIMAIVAQTARGQETVEGFQELLMARLQSMADSQDLVTASGRGSVVLAEVIGQIVAPFGKSRFDLDPGLSEVTIGGEMAAGMGLLLHEMATNAVKYGALSNRTGRVLVTLESAGDGRAAFVWRETGGPAVAMSNTPGFGTRLLKQVLRNQSGEVTFAFEQQGFRARAEFPTVR